MTPEKQRIAIAEVCGWKSPNHPDSLARREGWWSQHKNVWWIDPNGKDQMISSVPDYLNDLNAMHEAEKSLTNAQWDEYERVLRIVCNACSYYEGAGKEIIHATAPQRAEAFLRTLNLWDDEE